MTDGAPRIRSVRRYELAAIFDILEVCFPNTERALFERQTDSDSTFRLDDGVVAEAADGYPASFVRIFRRRMLLRGVPVPAGGIGSVATHPDQRRQSLASQVLEECIRRMRARGTALSFLYTGIIDFYERHGWRVVPVPLTTTLAEDPATLPAAGYQVRRFEERDLPALMRLYQADVRGATGAVRRTPRYWRDHRTWSDDTPDGFLVACRDGEVVAYVRSHGRIPVIQYLLEAVAAPGEEAALAALAGELAREAVARSCKLLGGMLPEDSAAAAVLSGLSSHRRLFDVRVPDMVMLVSARAALQPLLPSLAKAAASAPGPPLAAEIGDAVLVLGSNDARLEPPAGPAAGVRLRFDPHDAVLFLLGQRTAGECLADARGAVDEAVDRLDALFPRVPYHFWQTDRI